MLGIIINSMFFYMFITDSSEFFRATGYKVFASVEGEKAGFALSVAFKLNHPRPDLFLPDPCREKRTLDDVAE